MILFQLHGYGLTDNDDGGKPPYPVIKELTEEEREYVSQWMDFYTTRANGKCVAFLAEFLQQQKSGITDWKLP